MADFFISYTAVDVAWARWITAVLERAGFTTLYQDRDFPPGSAFLDKMHDAAKDSDRTLAVLSEEYLKSDYCAKEWQAAYHKRGKKDTTALVPVRVRPCEPDGLLKQIAYIDLIGSPDEPTSARLLTESLKPAGKKPGSWSPGTPATSTVRYPGSRPPHWNVPHERNPYFTGRDDVLAQISAALQSGSDVAITQPAAITGLGGIGKTSTAVEFCYRNRDRYEIVWWLRAETEGTLQADYADLARELSLPGRVENDIAASIQVVRDWLEMHGHWLLIFDNAESAEAIRLYLPHYRPGHILITSRDRHWDRVAKPIGVQRLDVDTASKFLLDRTESDDHEAAHAIAKELDGLPLALEHAAAYVRANQGLTLSDWLRYYRQERLQMFDPKEVHPPHDHPESVTVTWKMAFEQIRQTPFAETILNTIAFFAPDNIPNDLLLPCVASGREVDLNRAVAALTAHSLIERSDKGVSLHRLVQAVTREQMEDGERAQALEQALIIALNACPEGDTQMDVAGWPVYARLLPHLRAAAEHADQIGVQTDTLRRVWRNIGLYCQYCLGDYSANHHAFRRSLAIAEAIHDADHWCVGMACNDLGNALYYQGDYQGAKQAYERALSIKEAAYGKDHPEVAITVGNLGIVLRDLGDYQGARQAYERAIRIKEAAYGKDHPEVAITVGNLGNVHSDLGDFQAAKDAYERALRIKEAFYEENHPMIALTMCCLGMVLCQLGDLQGAKSTLKRALWIDEATYGSSHPSIAYDAVGLGNVLLAEGDVAGAIAMFERALSIRQQFLGPDHPLTKEAERFLQRARDKGK
jgi:tetratricopeptide (TPR) repeat protein